jgi:hypothetical protein
MLLLFVYIVPTCSSYTIAVEVIFAFCLVFRISIRTILAVMLAFAMRLAIG